MTGAALAFVILGALFEFSGILLIVIDTGRSPRGRDDEAKDERPGGGRVAGAGVEARLEALESAVQRLPAEIRREATTTAGAARQHGIRLRAWSGSVLLTGIVLLGIGNVLALA